MLNIHFTGENGSEQDKIAKGFIYEVLYDASPWLWLYRKYPNKPEAELEVLANKINKKVGKMLEELLG